MCRSDAYRELGSHADVLACLGLDFVAEQSIDEVGVGELLAGRL